MTDHTRYFSGKYPDEKKESPFQLTYYTYQQYIEYISEDKLIWSTPRNRFTVKIIPLIGLR